MRRIHIIKFTMIRPLMMVFSFITVSKELKVIQQGTTINTQQILLHRVILLGRVTDFRKRFSPNKFTVYKDWGGLFFFFLWRGREGEGGREVKGTRGHHD